MYLAFFLLILTTLCQTSQNKEKQLVGKSQRPTSQSHESASQTTKIAFEPEKNDSETDIIIIDPSEIPELEQEAQKQQSLIEKAVTAMQTVGSITQEFLQAISQKELYRILNMDKECKLTSYLQSLATEDEKGAMLTQALNQAVEEKSIDHTTRLLEIIHFYKLTDYVPAAHQNKAAQLLSAQTAKTLSVLLPLTQRNFHIGDLSPRAQSVQEALQATRLSYGHEPSEKDKKFVAELLEKIKNQKS
ncbi:hypothetical protein HYV11_03275 [Candidatus Dependentiae bacterium]|nr:hypothetical protein [Candidatus Dependentiae bacterium]